MEIQRCPECGQRLQRNYCDICMKRVPFRGKSVRVHLDPWDTSSAHSAEKDHECVSFDVPAQKKQPVSVSFSKPRRKSSGNKFQSARIAVILVVALSLLGPLFGLVEEFIGTDPMPDYNYEAVETDAEIPQISATQLYNDGQIQIMADYACLYYDDYALAFTIQNESDRDVVVCTDLLSVNGYMVDCGLYADVIGRGSQQFMMPLVSYELEEVGITDVAEIAFSLDIYDAQNYETIAVTDTITLRTDIAEGFVQSVDDSGWEMHRDENLRMVCQGAEIYEYGDGNLQLYMENLSAENLGVTIDGIWINGEAVSGFMWDMLRPETRAVDTMYFYDLEELEITELSQITDIYMEYTVETYEEDMIVDTSYHAVSFNPNDLPG